MSPYATYYRLDDALRKAAAFGHAEIVSLLLARRVSGVASGE